MKSLFEGFIFQERKLDHIHRLVVSEVTVSSREEFSPFSIYFHFLDDFHYEFFVFFFCILFIEDAVGSIFESYTSETIMDIIHTKMRIINLSYPTPYIWTEIYLGCRISDDYRLIASFKSSSPDFDIHSESSIIDSSAVSDIFAISDSM